MGLLGQRPHAALDLVTVAIFVLAPALLGFGGAAAAVAFALAGVHLVMTVATDFDFTPLSLVPLRLHGAVELVVGVVLAIVPWLLGGMFATVEQVFFTVLGLVILVVWGFTRYAAAEPA